MKRRTAWKIIERLRKNHHDIKRYKLTTVAAALRKVARRSCHPKDAPIIIGLLQLITRCRMEEWKVDLSPLRDVSNLKLAS